MGILGDLLKTALTLVALLGLGFLILAGLLALPFILGGLMVIGIGYLTYAVYHDSRINRELAESESKKRIP